MEVEFKKEYEIIKGDDITLKLIKFDDGDERIIPFYWYEIIPKEVGTRVGAISIRIGHNYHSYYNGNIGYEVDEPYQGHHYAYESCKLVLQVARDYGMDHIYITCRDDNTPSYKTIEKLGGELIERVVPPKDYFAYREGMPLHRIYRLKL